jgi:predicted Rossmann-fold nucleotide-binding protein
MEDVSRGAKSADGKTIGVTCYIWGKDRYTKPNQFIDKEIVADNLYERIDIMVKEADAFVIFPGGTGTLLELSATLELINKGLIKPKPIILFGEFWKPVLSCLENEPVFSKKIKNDCEISCCAELVTFAETTDECVEKIINSK